MERIIQIGINDDLLARLDQRAAERGVDRGSYIRDLIEAAVTPASGSLSELLSPLRKCTEEVGLSEAQVEELLDKEVAEARAERRRSRRSERLAG